MHNKCLPHGQSTVVIFCAKTRKKAANCTLPMRQALYDKEVRMKFMRIVIFSILFISGCGGESEEELTCNPVILPAVNVQFFDTNQVALNICDTILTIDRAVWNEVIFGSATSNCSSKFSLSYGDDLIVHNLLVEKAGFISQRFESLVPVATQCGYETLNLSVSLVAN